MVSVYDYTDYRCFLKDGFYAMKKKKPSFSYRVFNRQAGIRSSGYLKLVMDGKRNLANDGIRMIARGFKLNEEERQYFENLVRFNQAKEHDEKDRFFRKLAQNKKFIAAKPLTAAQYHLFSHWYYVAILELVRSQTEEIKDAKWLQRRLNPSVVLKDIKKAVKQLKQLKLINEDKNGSFYRLETMLKTEDEVHSLSVANFHVEMCQMAARAVREEPAQDREFSALTIITSEKVFQRAKEEIQEFRKRLHSILEQDTEGPKNLVAQINMQLFKLSGGGSEA